MKKLICRLDGFRETWLDPGMWKFHLQGIHVTVSGHRVDTDHPRYEVIGSREYKYYPCVRCREEVSHGWRRFWGIIPDGQEAR